MDGTLLPGEKSVENYAKINWNAFLLYTNELKKVFEQICIIDGCKINEINEIIIERTLKMTCQCLN